MQTSEHRGALTLLHGGRVLHAAGQWDEVPLHLAGGSIVTAATAGKALDTTDCLVLPGIVDFHGDAFERQIMPRPNVRFPLEVAMLDTDRQLAGNGITTALHGVTHSWEGGLRGRETALEVLDALERLQARLQVDHKVHLRFECHNMAGEADAVAWLESGRVSLLSFNDHLPGMRHKPHKWQEWADRAHTDVAGFMARMDAAAQRTGEVTPLIGRLAAHARRRGIPMASHDDHAVAVRDFFNGVCCRISEFPLNREVAEHARRQGSAVVCGGPNVLRGGSHVGAPSAAEMAADRLCTIIASDYYYPAPLHAAFRLAAQGLLPLHEAWALVSANPAAALTLTDRGVIEVGRRADLIVVDARDMLSPRLLATVCAGRIAYLADGLRLHD